MTIIRICAIAGFSLCLAVSVFLIARYFVAAHRAEAAAQSLRDELPPATPRPTPTPAPTADPRTISGAPDRGEEEPEFKLSIRFKALYDRNSDLAGWVSIDGTRIDYPVMQTKEDGEYYLSHGFDKSEDINGLPFLDERCGIAPKNQIQIIYGHNMNSGIMFHDLTLYKDEDFWREHQYIIYDTLYEEGVYQIAAAFVFPYYANPESFNFHRFMEFTTEKRFDEYKAGVEKLALYDTGVDYGADDQYLILATCERRAANSRFVVLAKLV